MADGNDLMLTSGDGGVIGSGRWKDGKTEVVLRPFGLITKGHQPGLGIWDTKRGSDIDSSGGSEWAVYQHEGDDLVLKVVIPGDDHPEKARIQNYYVSDSHVQKRTGLFWFRNAWTHFRWEPARTHL